MKTRFILLLVFSASIFSCSKQPKTITITAEDYHKAIDNVTAIQVHDIFSPPVAARIFSYSSIAAYETIQENNENYQSLAGQLRELTATPPPDDTTALNYRVAALVAFYDIAKQLIFSEDQITTYRDSLYTMWENENATSFTNSKNYGLKVAQHIRTWMAKDMYAET
ncbi:MAG: phosphatidic acid phosphatase, partial [Leeuwenhoekiella sp.]